MANHSSRYYAGSMLIIVAACLWALDGVLRRSLYSLPPLTIVWYEHLIGLTILVGFMLLSKRWQIGASDPTNQQPRWSFSPTSHKLGAAVGLLSGLIGTLAFTAALQQVNFIPFSVVLLLQKLTPIFAGIVAMTVLKERVTRQYLVWAIGAMVAAYFVTFPNGAVSLASGTGQLIAAGLAVLAAASWGSSTTISKLLLQRETPARATALRFAWTLVWGVAAGLLLAIGAGLAGSSFSFTGAVTNFTQTSSLPAISQLLTLVAIALSTGMVALLLYYRGLRTVPVLIAAILELVFPLLAVAIDVFLYNTILLPSQYLAAAVMIFCVYMTDRSRVIAPRE